MGIVGFFMKGIMIVLWVSFEGFVEASRMDGDGDTADIAVASAAEIIVLTFSVVPLVSLLQKCPFYLMLISFVFLKRKMVSVYQDRYSDEI